MIARPHITARRYCAAIFAAGVAAVIVLGRSLSLQYMTRRPLTFGVLSAALILTEALPVKIPRRGEEEEITLSTSFSMALLLAGGLGPAVAAQGVASIIEDRASGKPWWRVRFNVGQYTLSLVAAYVVLRGLSDTSQIGSSHPFTAGQLPIVLLSSGAFFVTNVGLVGTAIALYQGVPIRRYFEKDLFFVMTTAGVLLLLAPIVIAATAYSPLLVPLFAAPILAIHRALQSGARSEYAARHDPLTGLPNRIAFYEAVKEVLKDRNSTASVLLMDLDRFKEVNDTLGHHYGDLLLQQVAQRLREQLRSDDRIARLGGDEFAVLSENGTRETAIRLAERLANSLRSPFELEQIVMDVQVSIGIAMFPEDGAEVETLLQRADVAMYRAKDTRSDIAQYDERHDHHSPGRLALSADLRAALQAMDVVPWYQPELDIKSGDVFAVEALVRWRHPQLGLLPPAAFLELAEHTKLIKPLTQRVLEVALRQLVEWDALGIEVAMAVNVSTVVLVDDDFTALVTAALETARVSPSRLKLEVTESTLMSSPEVTRAILQELNRTGIEIAIDDFGIGYSSLAYLADLPASEIKIDRSFVGRMAHRSKESIIVNSTIDLAHHLSLRAVAEGVEEPATLSRLKALGCDAAQGHLISPPLRADELTGWFAASRGVARMPAGRYGAACS